MARDLPQRVRRAKARHGLIFAALCLKLQPGCGKRGDKNYYRRLRNETRKLLKSAYHEYQDFYRHQPVDEWRATVRALPPERSNRQHEIYGLLIKGINDSHTLIRRDLFELVIFYDLVLELVK